MRIHEIAKEFSLSSSDVIALARERGLEVRYHMSSVTPEQAEMLRGALAERLKEEVPGQDEAAPEETPAAPPEPETPAEEEGEPLEEEGEGGKVIRLKGPVVVKDFAEMLGLKPNQLIAQLMSLNVFASISQSIDVDVAAKLGAKVGVTVEQEVKKKKAAPKPPPPPSAPRKPRKVREAEMPDAPEGGEVGERPPIVTFMGHVDHGKTSLLDKIRDASVASGEDGGITQHIGAYTVEIGDRRITFLDTPGHAAFTAMRARGANITDIAVVVIAAEDGIMPQTREAVQHAQAAGVCIMVAINKIDLPGAQVDRVKQQLQEVDLQPEEWGGQTLCCPVSAATGEGIENLLEMIALQAEVLELKAQLRGPASGYVVEAQMERGSGPTATLLVRSGTLKVGDAVVCGAVWGRIKALMNDKGVRVRTAGPSAAVKCTGLTDVPEAGAEFEVYPNDREARAVAEQRKADLRRSDLTVVPQRASLEDFLNQEPGGAARELNLLLKTDVKGSLEALEQSLNDIKSDKVSLHFVLTGVGNVSGNDVLLASASNAVIFGFHVGVENAVNAMAKHQGVEVRLYSIIYEMIDDVRAAMTGLLEPILREKVLGHAEVRQVFDISRKGRVAGCMVTDGRATPRANVRALRKDEKIFEGRIGSLKRFQNDASEIREGQECGVRLDSFGDVQVGDVLEFFEVEHLSPEL